MSVSSAVGCQAVGNLRPATLALALPVAHRPLRSAFTSDSLAADALDSLLVSLCRVEGAKQRRRLSLLIKSTTVLILLQSVAVTALLARYSAEALFPGSYIFIPYRAAPASSPPAFGSPRRTYLLGRVENGVGGGPSIASGSSGSAFALARL